MKRIVSIAFVSSLLFRGAYFSFNVSVIKIANLVIKSQLAC